MTDAVAQVIGEDARQNDALAEAEDRFIRDGIERVHQEFIAFRMQPLHYGGFDFPALTQPEAEAQWKLAAVRNGIWRRQ